MKKMRWKHFVIAAASACILAGCNQYEPIETPETQKTTEAQTEETSASEIQTGEIQSSESSSSEPSETSKLSEASLADIKNLVGMKDEDTANLFGGGQENWSNDFYIGRIYQVTLDGNEYSMFTSCGQDDTVESVSLWIVNGERDVTDEEVQYWENQLSALMGTEPSYDEQLSEGGSRNRKWISEGCIAGMNQMKDILTISFQPAVGELK